MCTLIFPLYLFELSFDADEGEGAVFHTELLSESVVDIFKQLK